MKTLFKLLFIIEDFHSFTNSLENVWTVQGNPLPV